MRTARPTDTSDPRPTAEPGAPAPLPPRDAYRLWAPSYAAETAVSALDDLAVSDLAPAPPARALLDAGCGTARRLPPPGEGGLVVGVDLVYEMLAAGRRLRNLGHRVAAADIRALPFPADNFDTIWCRLVLGHVPDLRPAYQEFFRVSRLGGHLIVTDFHPGAVSAGHARTFRDGRGVLHAVETHPHTSQHHEAAAREAGFRLDRSREWRVGPEVRRFYQEASALERYEQQRGMPLVMALRFAK